MLWVCRPKLGYAGLGLTRSTRNPKSKRRRPNADDLVCHVLAAPCFYFLRWLFAEKQKPNAGDVGAGSGYLRRQ